MAFELPKLPYAYNAFDEHFDAKTMEIHHTKHHQAYINNLNTALEKHAFLKNRSIENLLKNLPSVPEEIRTAVRNNGGGHYNHSLFWTLLSAKGGGEATGPVGEAINSTFGSFDQFKELFAKAATTRFGSGWAWLSVDAYGHLVVSSSPNQDSPLMDGQTPILGLDVWEHAYYLKYQNRRADYIGAFWKIVNWEAVNNYYKQASGQ